MFLGGSVEWVVGQEHSTKMTVEQTNILSTFYKYTIDLFKNEMNYVVCITAGL